jgi:hypothetical protein
MRCHFEQSGWGGVIVLRHPFSSANLVAEENILLSAGLGWLSGKMERNTVLSVSPNKEKLIVRHTTLRIAGMKVVSVLSPAEARF